MQLPADKSSNGRHYVKRKSECGLISFYGVPDGANLRDTTVSTAGPYLVPGSGFTYGAAAAMATCLDEIDCVMIGRYVAIWLDIGAR